MYTYGYELEVIALDASETVEISQNITVIFSAECDIPVFNPDDRMGWFRFVSSIFGHFDVTLGHKFRFIPFPSIILMFDKI